MLDKEITKDILIKKKNQAIVEDKIEVKSKVPTPT